MIFEVRMNEGYEWVNTTSDKDFEVFLAFDGTPKASTWKPVKVKRVRSDDRSGFLSSDFPWLGGHALIFREKALHALTEIFRDCGETLPLETEDGTELFVHNTKVIDALDEVKSKIIRFPISNRIMRIISPSFKGSLIKGVNLFRLPYRSTPTYVSDTFVKMYKENGLVGLKFQKTDLKNDISGNNKPDSSNFT